MNVATTRSSNVSGPSLASRSLCCFPRAETDVLRSKRSDDVIHYEFLFCHSTGARGRREGSGEGQLGPGDITTEELEIGFNLSGFGRDRLILKT